MTAILHPPKGSTQVWDNMPSHIRKRLLDAGIERIEAYRQTVAAFRPDNPEDASTQKIFLMVIDSQLHTYRLYIENVEGSSDALLRFSFAPLFLFAETEPTTRTTYDCIIRVALGQTPDIAFTN